MEPTLWGIALESVPRNSSGEAT